MKTSHGFTVMELLVVAAIFIILFAVSIVNFRYGQKIEILKVVGQQLAGDISLMQTSALTGLAASDSNGFTYGINIKSANSSYLLFRDNNNNLIYDQDSDELIKSVDLTNDFVIEQILLAGQNLSELNLVFLPPRPTLYANGVAGQAVSIKINHMSVSSKSVQLEIEPIAGRIKQSLINN